MYTMKILSSKEFDELPVSVTRGSKIDDSLGFADPATNTAYVRHTAWPELNQYLMDHEFNHLLEEHKTDMDENGICHKKNSFGSFFDTIFNPTTWFNPERQNQWANFAVLNPWGEGAGGHGGGPMPVAYGAFDKPSSQQAGVQGQSNQNSFDINSLGNLANITGQYGGTFSDQAAQSPSGMWPGAGGGSIGIMQPGLGQGGIAMGAQNTLGSNSSQDPSMSISGGGFDGMNNPNFNNMFQGMSF